VVRKSWKNRGLRQCGLRRVRQVLSKEIRIKIMKIQFKVQDYQTDAVAAVVDCFNGQPLINAPKYAIDPGVNKTSAPTPLLDGEELEGFRNADLRLNTSRRRS